MRHPIIFIAALAITCLQALPANAVTISNCDEIEHKVSVSSIGSEVREYTLAPGRSVELFSPVATAQVEGGLPIRMQDRDVYCIRKGKISLQMRRKYSNKRQ